MAHPRRCRREEGLVRDRVALLQGRGLAHRRGLGGSVSGPLAMHSERETSALLAFERLIPDSVAMAMRVADPGEFLHWVQRSLTEYATDESIFSADATLARALAFAWARAVWNG